MVKQSEIVGAIERALIELNYAAADLRLGITESGEQPPSCILEVAPDRVAAASRAIDLAVTLLSIDPPATSSEAVA